MKRIMIFAALAALCLSCSKETAPEEGLEEIVFSVSNSPKTILSGVDILWESADEISLFDETPANRRFTTSDSGASALFSGQARPSSRFVALYPYNASASLEGDLIHTAVPADQSAADGSFASGANLSAAILSGSSAEMKNVCAYVRFTLAPSTLSVTSMKFEAVGGEALAGPVEIDMSGSIPSASASSGAVPYVNLVPSKSVSSGTFYMTVIPGALSAGFNLSFFTSDGKTLVKKGTSAAPLTRSNILDLGTIDLSSLLEIVEEPDDTSSDPVSAYASYGVDFSKLKSAGHPRLFMTAADFAALKERVVNNPDPSDIAYKLHLSLIKNADSAAATDEVATHTIVGGKRMLTQSRNALERLFATSYAYRTTGNEKYLTKARTELAAVCDPTLFPDWNAKIHFLDPSEMALAVAVAYDWLYYDLTLAERTAAHAALVNYELTPFKTYTPSSTNNWNMVCNGGAIAAAIAVYEKDKAIAAYDIDRAIKSNLKAADYYYNPNGNGLEGNGYWSYAMDFQIVVINALETAFGTSCGLTELSGLKKTGPWKLFMTGPTGGFNFSDSGSNSLGSTCEFIWLAARFNMPELLVREWSYLNGSSYSSSRVLPLMMCGLIRYPFVASPASFPSEKIWSANDLAPIVLTRVGWNYDEKDKYFGLKGSGTVNGHSHMDAGTFVYDAFGVRWACESKMGDYNVYEHLFSGLFSYGQKSLRWELLQQNCYFHNTLSFTWSDGSVDKWNVTDHVVGSRGSVVSTFDEPDGCGGTVDLSCYFTDAASSVKRTAKIAGEELQIIDEITSKASHSAPFEWRMLTECDVKLEDGYIELSSAGKTVYLYTRHGSNVVSEPVYGYEPQIVRPSTWVARDWETVYNNFTKFHVVKFSSEVASGSKTATFTTVISPLKPSDTGAYASGEIPDFSNPDDAKW